MFLSRNDLRSSARRWLEGGVAIISQGVPIHGAIAGERMGEGGLWLLPHLISQYHLCQTNNVESEVFCITSEKWFKDSRIQRLGLVFEMK